MSDHVSHYGLCAGAKRPVVSIARAPFLVRPARWRSLVIRDRGQLATISSTAGIMSNRRSTWRQAPVCKSDPSFDGFFGNLEGLILAEKFKN